jgi:hypothetical protein
MWLLTPGAFPQVWEDFDPRVTPNRLKKLGYIGTDHSQWSRVLGPNQPTWTAADGVVSYRYHCQRGLPPGARIVFFHGKEKPWTVREDWVREHYIGRD